MDQDNTLLTPEEEKKDATTPEVAETSTEAVEEGALATAEETTDTPPAEAEAEVTEEVKEEVDTTNFTASELLQHLDQMVRDEQLPDLQEMKRLKRLINNEAPVANDDADLDETEEDGEERSEESEASKDELLTQFLNLKTRYHELSAKKQEEEKLQREENYQRKLVLLKRLEDNINSTDDFYKIRNEFENIRSEWKSIGHVPENVRNEVLTKYSKLLDEHYTINKLNKEAQEYDFKHNRKEKEQFIEKARALADESDVVKAFRELQTLHDLWKETGPVAPEFRDSMWKDFKDASTVINKKHDDYFKQLHEKEEENYTKKVAIVERLENMLIKLPTTRDAWRNYEKKMNDIRTEWKAAGRVPRAKSNEVNMRFRVAVDEFYLQRRSFMKDLSDQITPKLERMRELAAEAEALADSTDWQKTARKLQDMQKEWTEVSKLGTRVAEAQRLWKRFRAACDTFFNARSANRRSSREDNLEKKLVVVDKIEELLAQKLEDPSAELREIEAEWGSIGPVPDDQKDDVLNRYYRALRILKGEGRRDNRPRKDRRQGDHQRRSEQRDRRPQKVNLQKDLTELSNPQLEDERSNIQRNISSLEEELLQYETNIGFFNASPDNPMIVQIQGKIDALKAKIEQFQERIREINEEIKNPAPKEESTETTETSEATPENTEEAPTEATTEEETSEAEK